MCDCATCQELQEIEDNLQRLPEESRQFFSDLADTLMHARTELGRAACVIDGSWPGADEEITEARRARAERERVIPNNVVMFRQAAHR